MQVARRTLMRTGALASVPAALVLDQRPTAAAPRLPSNPFKLGVASGEPTSGGFVMWTRLAIRPLAADGRGGVPDRTYTARFQVARDPGFRDIVRAGEVDATPSWGHSARAVIRGLEPAREYWYRWRVQGYLSPVGRAVTAPGPDAPVSRLRAIQLCCSSFAAGYFHAYRYAASERADVVIHLGDYIYEGPSRSTDFRQILGDRCHSLADFRQRYAQYRTDRDLQAAHAASPWLVTFDDHEVENNYAGLEPSIPKPDFAAYRARAYKAWFENQPVSWRLEPNGAYLRMHRRLAWGNLVNLHLLDTRQYRSDQPCNGSFGDCPDRVSPDRTMLGSAQLDWLRDNLARSPKRWDVLAQQVFFSRRHVYRNGELGYLLDAWDGYEHSRNQLRDLLHPDLAPAPRNSVVLTGDTHEAWLCDVKADYLDPASPTVATEVGCTSISSAGDGYDSDGSHPFMKRNPHIRFHNALRGYCRLTFEPDQLTVDYRVVDAVRRPEATMWTRASFVIPDREPTAAVQSQVTPDARAPRVLRAPEDPAAATLREALGAGGR